MKPLQQRLTSYTAPDDFRKAGIYPYFRTVTTPQLPQVLIDGKPTLMLGSNSYLGLTDHPKVQQAAIDAIKRYGSGCAGSPFLNGTLDLHHQLEKAIAEFLHKDDAMLFSAGFQANAGTIPALLSRNDHLIIDERDHASIMETRRQTIANVHKYRHSDFSQLRRILDTIPRDAVKLLATDAVFSMEGDLVPLPELVEICKEYQVTLMLDEAHSLGVFGNQGRGLADHFGVIDDVDILMGTFSKSLASVGGYIASDARTIDFLRHNVRPYIFTASIPPAATASALAALQVMQEEPWRQENLWKVTNYALKRFREEGFEVGPTETPIIPLYVRDNEKTFQVTRLLHNMGIFVNPVVAPAVPSGDTLIRLSWMATHTIEHVDYAVDNINAAFRKLNLK